MKRTLLPPRWTRTDQRHRCRSGTAKGGCLVQRRAGRVGPTGGRAPHHGPCGSCRELTLAAELLSASNSLTFLPFWTINFAIRRMIAWPSRSSCEDSSRPDAAVPPAPEERGPLDCPSSSRTSAITFRARPLSSGARFAMTLFARRINSPMSVHSHLRLTPRNALLLNSLADTSKIPPYMAHILPIIVPQTQKPNKGIIEIQPQRIAFVPSLLRC